MASETTNDLKVATMDFVDREIRRIREVVETRLDGMDEALKVQLRETLRRLDELNHAHEKAVEDRAAFLPRETFDGFLSAFESLRAQVVDKVGAQQLAGVEARLAQIEVRGSSTASDALKEVRALEDDFNELSKGTATAAAVEANQQHIRDYDRRLRWLIVGVFISLVGMAASVIFGILMYVKK